MRIRGGRAALKTVLASAPAPCRPLMGVGAAPGAAASRLPQVRLGSNCCRNWQKMLLMSFSRLPMEMPICVPALARASDSWPM